MQRFACIGETETGCVQYACHKNLSTMAIISWRLFTHFCTRKRAAPLGLIHACLNVSAGLCAACAFTTLYLLASMFLWSKSQLNISSRSCHWALCAALRCPSVAETNACMFIHTRMHANSDKETVLCMRGLHDGEIHFTSTIVVFKRS